MKNITQTDWSDEYEEYGRPVSNYEVAAVMLVSVLLLACAILLFVYFYTN